MKQRVMIATGVVKPEECYGVILEDHTSTNSALVEVDDYFGSVMVHNKDLTLVHEFKVQVTDQQLKDCLVTAVEGGIDYWSYVKAYDPDKVRVTITEIEASRPEPADPLEMTLSHQDLLRGLEILARQRPEGEFPGGPGHLRDFLTDTGDATTADVIVQLTMFGELVYG